MAVKKKAKKESYAPVRTGIDPRKDGPIGSAGWLKIDAGDSIDVVAMIEAEEILATEQCAIWLDAGNSPVWVYTGPDDPANELGLDKCYRAYIPFLVDGEVKVWSMGKTAHIQILDIADAGGELKGMVLRIKRTGSGLATRYSIVPRGKRVDVSREEEPDIISMLGPITSDEVRQMIAEKLNKESYEDVLTAFKGSKKTKRGKVVLPDPDEDEDEDEDDDDELEEIDL